MAKATGKQNIQSIKSKRQKKELSHLHFAMTSKNYMIIGLGIVLIVIGYFLMSENSVNGFLPTIIAPILLIVGYCVVVPVGILYNDKMVSDKAVEEVNEIKTEPKLNVSASSSNVKTV